MQIPPSGSWTRTRVPSRLLSTQAMIDLERAQLHLDLIVLDLHLPDTARQTRSGGSRQSTRTFQS